MSEHTQNPHDHELHRLDDDGAPAPKPRIGIAPESVTPNDTRREKQRFRDQRHGADVVASIAPESKNEHPRLILVGSDQPQGEAPRIVDHRGEEVSSLTWDSYLAWRKSKCRPYDYSTGPIFATELLKPNDGAMFGRSQHARALEEIDQATLEFIGEVAELGELFEENGPGVFYPPLREKLIDECGDIFFCGVWVLDAWGSNPLAGMEDLELMRVTDADPLAVYAGILATTPPRSVVSNERFMGILGGTIFKTLLEIQTNAGLLANSFKKLRYHRREQKVDVQVGRVATVLALVNQILVIANSSVEEALVKNQRKLNTRYPDGYQPGQGGGNRTGEGA